MTNNNVILLFLLIVIGISTCKKNEDESELSEDEIEVSWGDEILILGSENSMFITQYDRIVEAIYFNQSTVKIEFDLNQDGDDDITLMSRLPDNLGNSTEGGPFSGIGCLNEDTELFGFTRMDTTFLNYETVIDYGDSNEVWVTTHITSRCYRVDPMDSIIGMEPAYRFIPLDFGDTITLSDTYKSEEFLYLFEGGQYSMPRVDFTSGDTTFATQYSITKCGKIPNNEIKYIGFRHNKAKKMGWIKLEVKCGRIHLIESAIQK